MRHAERHAERLRRDCTALGLAPPPAHEVLARLHELGAGAFEAHAGVVRLAARPAADGGTRLEGATRALGPDPPTWSARVGTERHPGPALHGGVKALGVALYERARAELAAGGEDELLLLDAGDRLVEGARSNLFVVREDGRLVTPPLARGAVAGIARALVLEREPEACEEDVDLAVLARARELVAVNAVRGARRVRCPAAPAQDDASAWTRRLDALLAADA